MRRDHLIVLYLCGQCSWKSASICEPRDPPPRTVTCEACAADGRASQAEPVEGILASAGDARRVAELCMRPDPEDHREAFRLLSTLRGPYRVVITAWAREQPVQGEFDAGEFKRRVQQERDNG